MEKKRYLQIAAVVIVILVLGAGLYNYVYLPSLPKELIQVKMVSVVPIKDGFWEYAYANYTGIYREEGLEVEVTIVRTPAEGAQALMSGAVDATATVDSTLAAYLGGAEGLKIVAVTMRPSYALFVRPDINSIQDVKSIGLPGRGSGADIMTREYLTAHGLKPEVDVSMQYLNTVTMLPAFLTGQVDAFAGGASAYAAFKDGKAKILFQYAVEFPQWCQSGIVVTEKTLTERPQVVKALTRALYRTQVSLLQNKDKAIDYAVNVLKLDKDYATFVYEFAYEGKYGAPTKMTPDMPVAELEYTLQIQAKYMGATAKPIQGCIDTTIMDQVKKELG